MITYSNHSNIESFYKPQAVPWYLESRGDGTGVKLVQFTVQVAGTVEIVGGGKFYDDSTGTTGETTIKSMGAWNPGDPFDVPTFLYIKVTSGTSKLKFSTKRINKMENTYDYSVNSPIVGGDFGNLIHMISWVAPARSKWATDISKLTELEILNVNSQYNDATVTGSLALLTKIKEMSLVDDKNFALPNGNVAISGDLSAIVPNGVLELVGDQHHFWGDITLIDPKFFYGGGDDVYQRVTADISAWTECYYLENDCPGITFTTIAGMTKCGYFQISPGNNTILTAAQVNQALADMLANTATAKTYANPSRTLDLTGAIGTAAPTGQGILDKASLIAWVGGGGEVWSSVITR